MQARGGLGTDQGGAAGGPQSRGELAAGCAAGGAAGGPQARRGPGIDAAAGAVAGIAARMASAPFDVLKIRQQLSTRAVTLSAVGGLGSVVELAQLAAQIWRNEGALAFWSGNVPALQLYALYSGVQFGSFGLMKQALEPTFSSPFLVGLIAGAGAGGLATVASFPLDVLRTRGAALGLQREEHTLSHAYFETANAPLAKARDLYRGVNPALLQIIPWMGLNFGIYEALRSFAPTDSFGQMGIYGAVSGTVSKLAVFPLDLAKKRLQMQGVAISEAHAANGISRMPAYRNLLHCLVEVWRHEGAAGIFRGVLPGLLKAAPASGASFLTFELVRSFYLENR
ncbi:mitochondrial carrier domain-containing protein [Pavlovales sp. CCMP2436]|nr:mitochondrial carrier domain-containing protein [Pavlovales sp. CCMP2436]